jgi:hypothetical protein
MCVWLRGKSSGLIAFCFWHGKDMLPYLPTLIEDSPCNGTEKEE